MAKTKTKTKKLTEQELESLKNIQNNNRVIIEEFGKIKISELNLDIRKKSAENFLSELRTQEANIAKTLEDKYGKGSVNTDTGEFIPLD